MKRFTIFLSIVLLLFFCSCSKSEQEFEDPANFYYPNKDVSYGVENGVISFETQETSHIKNDLYQLLDRYLKGPNDISMRCPISSDVTVEEITAGNNSITIVFSQEFTKLSGIDLTLASTCLGMTLLDYTQADYIEIRVRDALLEGSESIVIAKDDLLFTDNLLIPDETE